MPTRTGKGWKKIQTHKVKMVKSKCEDSLCRAQDNKWKKPFFWAVKILKDAKEPVMKQFNSTSGKSVILPLYSTVELEDRTS